VRQLALGRTERRLDHLLESENFSGIDPYEAADRVIPKLGSKLHNPSTGSG
jgi:hypothetical protein